MTQMVIWIGHTKEAAPVVGFRVLSRSVNIEEAQRDCVETLLVSGLHQLLHFPFRPVKATAQYSARYSRAKESDAMTGQSYKEKVQSCSALLVI